MTAAAKPPCQEGKCLTRSVVYAALALAGTGCYWAADKVGAMVDRQARIETSVARLEIQMQGVSEDIKEIKEAIKPPKLAGIP